MTVTRVRWFLLLAGAVLVIATMLSGRSDLAMLWIFGAMFGWGLGWLFVEPK